MSSHVTLTFRCLSNFYQCSIQGFSRIAVPLTLILKISGSIESITRLGKGGVRVGDDSGDDAGYDNGATSLSSSTDLSTGATQIAVDYDGVDGGVASESKNRQKVEKPQKSKKLQRLLVRRNAYQSIDPPSI